MPAPAPTPPRSIRQQLVRITRIAAAFAIVIAAVAVLLVARGQTGVHLHMLIATALGVGLTVLLGIALMALIFLSNRGGHDDHAAAPPFERDDS